MVYATVANFFLSANIFNANMITTSPNYVIQQLIQCGFAQPEASGIVSAAQQIVGPGTVTATSAGRPTTSSSGAPVGGTISSSSPASAPYLSQVTLTAQKVPGS